jgi:uncharacterized protein (TIGR02996 family)
MSYEDAFLTAIGDAPGDDTPRLVYADWLEDGGQPERAEFVRVQCRWDAADPTDPSYWDLGTREWNLRASVGSDWLDRLDGVAERSHRTLWARCVRASDCLAHPEGRRRARRSARNLMRRVRRNVETLVDRLTAAGYRFVQPARVHLLPSEDDLAEIASFERDTGWTFPVSLAAFLREVGSVDLMGAHPNWPNPAYFFPDTPWALDGPPHWYTDPLVVEFFPTYQLDQLRDDAAAGGERLSFDFAPDLYHKSNVSGGGGVGVAFDRRALEATYTGSDQPFVEYLRTAFQWGGLPGFQHIAAAPRPFLRSLRRGLLAV